MLSEQNYWFAEGKEYIRSVKRGEKSVQLEQFGFKLLFKKKRVFTIFMLKGRL